MRRIVSTQRQTTQGADVDTYFDRIIKYIPADIVGAWVAIMGLISGNNASSTVLWIMFIIMVAITAAWTYKQTRTPFMPPAVTQIIVSTLSFAVWVFALGGPFATLPWYRAFYGSLALIVYTLVIGLIVPDKV